VWSRDGQTYNTSGIYTYTFANGICTDTVRLSLTINNGSRIDTAATVCNSYTWPRNGQTYNTSGIYTYTYVNGTCTDTIKLNLTIQSAPNLIITNPAGVCSPGTIDITVPSITAGSDAGLTYSYWSNAAATIPLSNPNAISVSGTYYIKAVKQGSCSVIAPVKLTINAPPTVIIAGAGTICSGSSTVLTVSLTGTAPFRFTYTDGTNTFTVGPVATTTYQFTVEPVTNTTYTINSVTDAYCSSAGNLSSAVITVIPGLQPVRYPTLTTAPYTPLQLDARNLGTGYTYNWNPPTGLSSSSIKNPVFNYNRPTEYTIEITSPAGCTVVDSLRIIIRDNSPTSCNSDIFVPRAWTPNGDGHNDKLFPLTVCITELKYFRIFNRWGQLVFETNILGYGWDGIFRGSPQVSDVYTWTVEAVGVDGKHYKRTGTSVLLR
jgi:gliding motility-associated-like protein